MKKQKSETSLRSCAEDRSVRIQIEPDTLSETSSARTFKKRASLAPVVHELKKIKDIHGVGSIGRETKHFCETTTMHGPKRIYGGKRWARFLWLLVYLGSWAFLIVQIAILVTSYLENPTVSQVSFLINEKGIPFPSVTLCSFNPIKKSNVDQLNATGDFAYELLDYLMESNMDAPALYSAADRDELRRGDQLLTDYQKTHPNFTANSFFNTAGFACPDIMMMCSFGGLTFNCCRYVTPVITSLGKCYTLKLNSGPEWMKKQISAGVDNGLQIVLDAREDEQVTSYEDADNAVFSTTFENGFRFFVHEADKNPNPSTEGVSVSPSTRVYTALSVNNYILLTTDKFGYCSDDWPKNFKTSLPYTTVNCETFCRAQYFNDTCGCTPSTYNIDGSFDECTPLETVTCMDTKMRREQNGEVDLGFPLCDECKIECKTIMYNSYNSYGNEFNPGSLKWLSRHNFNRTTEHIRKNFLTVNVFFRDMTHVEYTQRQASSVTELLSNIGGNMGMFLGMSIITVAECMMYLSKIAWIAISRKRREYMYTKAKHEKEQDNEVQETVRNFKFLRNRISPDDSTLREKIRVLDAADLEAEADLKMRQPSEQDSESLADVHQPSGNMTTKKLERLLSKSCDQDCEKALVHIFGDMKRQLPLIPYGRRHFLRMAASIFMIVTVFSMIGIVHRSPSIHEFTGFLSEESAIPLIIVITPTYRRPTRIADMTRMANTLRNVRHIHWIVVEDNNNTIKHVRALLNRSQVAHTYFAVNTAVGYPKKGWFQRTIALNYIRHEAKEILGNHREAVVYFGDDDNSYDIRLFDNYIRKVKRLGMWAVAFSGGAPVEAPRVVNGKVTGFNVRWNPNRRFAVDMAGFAINLREVLNTTAVFGTECKRGLGAPETCLLEDMGFTRNDIEPFGTENEFDREILVWHTKTKQVTYDLKKMNTFGYIFENGKNNSVGVPVKKKRKADDNKKKMPVKVKA